MRVLIISSLFAPHIGGVETFVSRLTGLLRDAGHETVRLGCRHPESEADFELPTRFVGSTSWPIVVGGLSDLRSAVSESDVVLINNWRQPLVPMACRAARRAGVPAILFPHLNDLDEIREMESLSSASRAYFGAAQLWERLLARPMTKSAELAVFSKYEADYVGRHWPEMSPPILPYPVLPIEQLARPKTLRLVWAGRFVREKGPQFALEAAIRVSEQRPVSLDFFGDGPLREEVQAAAAGMDWVRFHGAVAPQVVRAAQAGGIVLSSSLLEGIQLGVLEPLCSGIPTIATRTGEIPNYFSDELGWACVEPGDASALASAVLALAKMTDDDLDKFTRNGASLLRVHGVAAERGIVRFIEERAEGRFRHQTLRS